jgi:glycosyltransferase involved in cell wall biosynthesis
MRILNICAYTWAIGGPARIIYDHTTEALKHGHSVTILSPMTPGEKMYDLPTGATLIPCRRTTPVSYIYREFSLDLYAYLKKHIQEYDIIHIHGIWHFGSLAPFLIKNEVPKVVTIHGLLDRWAIGHSRWKKELVSFLYQKKVLAKAELIQVNNTDEVEDVTRYLGQQPSKLVVIPNGMRMEEFSHLPPQRLFRTQFGILPNAKMVLFMGRLNIKKGLGMLLPAFAQYLKSHSDAVLILAGPDDGYQEETESFIQEHGLADQIKLVGMLTNSVKMAALADADLFVLPSYSEGFSIAVLEAMAAGVPTLVSDRVGFGDYIRQYDAAYLTALTPDAIQAGLISMLQDESRRTEIKQNALRMLTENFDISMVARQLLEAYESVLKSQ